MPAWHDEPGLEDRIDQTWAAFISGEVSTFDFGSRDGGGHAVYRLAARPQ